MSQGVPRSAVARLAGPSRPEESLATTLRRLGSAQKGAAGAPGYSRFVNRKLGRLIAAVAFHAGLTPNAVTGISALFTFTGITLIAVGAPSWALGGCVAALLVVGYALDSADGQLARVRGGGSPAGEWLDHMVDALKIASLHLAVLIGLFRSGAGHGTELLLPLGFSVAAVVHFFATLLNESLRAQHGATTRAAAAAARPSIRRSLLVLPTDYGMLCLVFVLLGAPTAFLWVYGLLGLASAGYLALACITWFREMEALSV